MANCVKCGRTLPGLTFGKNRKICKWCVEYEAMHRGEVRGEVTDGARNGVQENDQRQPVMPVPWSRSHSHSDGMIVTQAIAGLCAAVFIGMALATNGDSIMNPPVQQLIHWGANYGPRVFAGQWWRLLTSVFLHIGIIHIALNMWCLWKLGELAESLYGHVTFAAVYLICGLAGSLASVAYHPGTVSAGASGAIFGIAGALISSLKLGEFSMPAVVVKSMLKSVVMFAGYNLIFGAMSGVTDNAAHIGGLVAGLILGALIALADRRRENAMLRVTAIVVVLLAVIGGAGWLQHAKAHAAHVQRAQQLLGDGKADEAIAELQTAIRAHPDDAFAHYNLAHAYSKRNRVAEEEAELKRVLQLQPNAPYAAYQLGILYLEQKRAAESQQMFEKVLASNGQHAGAHLGMGLLLAAKGSDEAAIKEFNIAVASEPETRGAYHLLANSYARLHKYDDAIAAYQQAIKVDGDDYNIESALAAIYQAKGMKTEAEQARRMAAELQKK